MGPTSTASRPVASLSSAMIESGGLVIGGELGSYAR